MAEHEIENSKIKLSKEDLEIVHHATFCNKLIENISDRDEYFEKVLSKSFQIYRNFHVFCFFIVD